jgi:hypothetical protein
MSEFDTGGERKIYTDAYTRRDAERAIQAALAAFSEQPPGPDQVEHLDDAIAALLTRNHGIAFVLAMGAVLHGRREAGFPGGESLERLKRSFDSAKRWLDTQTPD